MKKVVLFDLDGTIIDSEEGVTKCVQYAVGHFGIEETDLKKLRIFIGPPLKDQMRKVYGFDEQMAQAAVAKFRERYRQEGMYECRLYPGVEETLGRLKEAGFRLVLASSKIETACRQILKHFGIDTYFEQIVGATEDGRISKKADVLRAAVERLGTPDVKDCILIGDTCFDVSGAKAVNMECIGVTYGFGTREELEESGAVYVCGSLEEVEAYLEK